MTTKTIDYLDLDGTRTLKDNFINLINKKANSEDLTEHANDGDIHITAEERINWDSAEANANSYTDDLNTAMNTRVEKLESNGEIYVAVLSDYEIPSDAPNGSVCFHVETNIEEDDSSIVSPWG